MGIHPGFLAGGNILNAIPNKNFSQIGYQIARITVEGIENNVSTPEPGLIVALLTTGGVLWFRHRQTI